MEETTAPLDKLAADLIGAQAELRNPPKTKAVQAGQKRYSFAPLPEIIDAVRPVLTKHHLAVTQFVRGDQLVTILLHESGQSMSGGYPLPHIDEPQALGTAITYARRYSICAVLGIAADDDDDAQAAEDAKVSEARKRMDDMAAQGKLKSAYDGRTLKPGETPAAAAPPAVKETPPPSPATTATVNVASTGKRVDPLLIELLKRDSVTLAQFMAWGVAKGNFPASMKPENLNSKFLDAVLLPANWSKVTAAIKGVKQ